MSRDERAVVQRISNLGDWEIFRVALEESDHLVCTVGIRVEPAVAGDTGSRIGYAVFTPRSREAEASSTVAKGRGAWSDDLRETVLRSVLGSHPDLLPLLEGGRVIAFERAGASHPAVEER